MNTLTLFLGTCTALVRAAVFCYFWDLFVRPLGVPAIGWLHAWGVACLIQITMVTAGAVKMRELSLMSDEVRFKYTCEGMFITMVTLGLMPPIAWLVLRMAGPI